MPKLKMIEVGARRLDRIVITAFRMIDHCHECDAFHRCTVKTWYDGWQRPATNVCHGELKRWLKCQQ